MMKIHSVADDLNSVLNWSMAKVCTSGFYNECKLRRNQEPHVDPFVSRNQVHGLHFTVPTASNTS
jgi:hypothetical protein